MTETTYWMIFVFGPLFLALVVYAIRGEVDRWKR